MRFHVEACCYAADGDTRVRGQLAGASGALRAEGTFSATVGGHSRDQGTVCLPLSSPSLIAWLPRPPSPLFLAPGDTRK